ncbi:hypothetical protein C8J56DRAFT_1049069 [Mycena floridula]|nr:hypothetical protein C8J56DRAFT_1049069 [Mycena floridula]
MDFVSQPNIEQALQSSPPSPVAWVEENRILRGFPVCFPPVNHQYQSFPQLFSKCRMVWEANHGRSNGGSISQTALGLPFSPMLQKFSVKGNTKGDGKLTPYKGTFHRHLSVSVSVAGTPISNDAPSIFNTAVLFDIIFPDLDPQTCKDWTNKVHCDGKVYLRDEKGAAKVHGMNMEDQMNFICCEYRKFLSGATLKAEKDERMLPIREQLSTILSDALNVQSPVLRVRNTVEYLTKIATAISANNGDIAVGMGVFYTSSDPTARKAASLISGSEQLSKVVASMKILKEDLAEQVTASLKFYDAASPVKETEPVVESSKTVTKKDIPQSLADNHRSPSPTAPSSKQRIQSDCKQRILALLAEAFGYNGQRVPLSTMTALLEKHQLRIDLWPPGWFLWVPGQPSWPKAAVPMSKMHWEEMLAWLQASHMNLTSSLAEQALEPGSAEYNQIAMVLTIAKMKEGASKQKVLAQIMDHQIEPIHLIAEESFDASRDMAEESKTEHYGFQADSPSTILYQQRNASDNYISLKQSHFEHDDGLSDAWACGQRHRSRTIRDDEFPDQSGQSAPQAWSSQTYYEESGQPAPQAGPSGPHRQPGPSEARPSNQPEVVQYQLPGPGSKRAKETRKLAKAANRLRNSVPENDWN